MKTGRAFFSRAFRGSRMIRPGSSRFRRFLESHGSGRIGSGPVALGCVGSRWVGSGRVFEYSPVGSGQEVFKTHGPGRVTTRPALPQAVRREQTRAQAWIFTLSSAGVRARVKKSEWLVFVLVE